MKYILLLTILMATSCSSERPVAAIDALKRVRAAAETGVTLDRYSNLVADARFEYLKACDPTKEPTEVCKHLSKASYNFKLAADMWEQDMPDMAKSYIKTAYTAMNELDK